MKRYEAAQVSCTRYIERKAEATSTGSIPSVIISTSAPRITAQPGETVTITCVARGTPIPAISWALPDNLQGDTERVEQPNFGRNLIIRNVQQADTGEYKCTAENKYDYGYGSTFACKLLVMNAPVFSILPNDATYNQGMCLVKDLPGSPLTIPMITKLSYPYRSGPTKVSILEEWIFRNPQQRCQVMTTAHAPRGERAVLRCGLRDKIGSISWLLNGKQVELREGKREMGNDNFLIIRDMTVEDVGMYQCIGSALGSGNQFVVQSSAYLSVRSGAKIIVDKKNMLRNAGERIRVRCTATGYPYPYVTWYKDDIPLIFNQSVRMVSVQDFVIDEAGGMDIGKYKCVARNSLGTDTLTRNLGIIVKASVNSLTASDPRGYYLVGQKIVLTCRVSGTRDVSIAWSKDNSEYLSDALKRAYLQEYFDALKCS
eukprot:sb/3464918/